MRILTCFVFLFFSIFLLNHCATPMTVPKEASLVLEQNRFPQNMRLKHRLLLEVRGKQYDFVGFLQMQQPDRLYAAAYSEAPAPIFEFKTVGSASAVIAKPDMLPETYLKDGVIEDLRAAFSHSQPNGGNKLWQVQQNAITTIYRVDQNKKILSRIEFLDYRNESGFRIPRRMNIKNLQYPYTLNATLLEFSVRPEDEAHDAP